MFLRLEVTRDLAAPPGEVLLVEGTTASVFLGPRPRTRLSEVREFSLAVYAPPGERPLQVVAGYSGLVSAH
jgi:hypothetical protein